MGRIIASTYEVIGKIGHGGSGEVYLANHIRLGKKVVLKRYRIRRNNMQSLRREVDVLKELNHPQIPKVYDFLREEGYMIAVMDYVEGESLDRCLKKGERYSEKTIIKWMKELLEALVYLHAPIHGIPPRGFIHSDIKPGNLMKRYDGSISLIDFNIALAVGEAMAIGYSPGYSSPEQCEFATSYSKSDSSSEQSSEDDFLSDEGGESKTKRRGNSQSDRNASGGRPSGRRTIPDVRSDLYSTGAAMYHLLSGEKPSKEATGVIPLSAEKFNPELVKIIMKAMNPDPDLRFQTAQEMLDAVRDIKRKDPRLRRRRIENRMIGISLTVLFCAGIGASFAGLKGMQTEERRKREAAELLGEEEESQKLTEYAENCLESGDTQKALDYALRAHSEHFDSFSSDTQAKVQLALTDTMGIYDISDGFKADGTITLSSQLLGLKLSPNGKYLACFYGYEIAIVDTERYETIAVLPTEESALAEMDFADDDHLLFAGRDGIELFRISDGKSLWKGAEATALCISADGKTAAALYKENSEAILYNMEDGTVITVIDFEGKKQWIPSNDRFLNDERNLFELNENGTVLAVSFADGSLWVYDLNRGQTAEIVKSDLGFASFQGGFLDRYLAFTAEKAEGGIFEVLDLQTYAFTGNLQSIYGFKMDVNEEGIFVNTANRLVRIDPETFEEFPQVKNVLTSIHSFAVSQNHTIVSTGDKVSLFNKDAKCIDEHVSDATNDFLEISDDLIVIGNVYDPVIRILRYQDHKESQFAVYPLDQVHSETRVSADLKNLMLFSRYGFSIYDLEGNQTAEVILEDDRNLYDVQYRRKDGHSYLERIYYDGSVIGFDANTGELAYEEQGEVPEPSLYEVFETSRYRIESVLHEAPRVYDRQSGEFICELQKKDNLTYITETGEYIAAQYISTDGIQYGVLMNNACEVIAILPCLSDVYNGELYFDYGMGYVRRCGIYDLEELLEKAEKESRIAEE